MTVKELKSILSRLPEEAELNFVTILDDGKTSQVDDISFEIAAANDDNTCFYLYSQEAIDLMDFETVDEYLKGEN